MNPSICAVFHTFDDRQSLVVCSSIFCVGSIWEYRRPKSGATLFKTQSKEEKSMISHLSPFYQWTKMIKSWPQTYLFGRYLKVSIFRVCSRKICSATLCNKMRHIELASKSCANNCRKQTVYTYLQRHSSKYRRSIPVDRKTTRLRNWADNTCAPKVLLLGTTPTRTPVGRSAWYSM